MPGPSNASKHPVLLRHPVNKRHERRQRAGPLRAQLARKKSRDFLVRPTKTYFSTPGESQPISNCLLPRHVGSARPATPQATYHDRGRRKQLSFRLPRPHTTGIHSPCCSLVCVLGPSALSERGTREAWIDRRLTRRALPTPAWHQDVDTTSTRRGYGCPAPEQRRFERLPVPRARSVAQDVEDRSE